MNISRNYCVEVRLLLTATYTGESWQSSAGRDSLYWNM